MNRDDIIRMARDAGFIDADQDSVWITDGFWTRELKRFAALVAAAEQDRCCKIIYSMAGSDNVAQRTVDAIRSNP